jgi:uncharacterized membrane protein
MTNSALILGLGILQLAGIFLRGVLMYRVVSFSLSWIKAGAYCLVGLRRFPPRNRFMRLAWDRAHGRAMSSGETICVALIDDAGVKHLHEKHYWGRP